LDDRSSFVEEYDSGPFFADVVSSYSCIALCVLELIFNSRRISVFVVLSNSVQPAVLLRNFISLAVIILVLSGIFLHHKTLVVAWLVGYHFCSREFWPYGITVMCIVITVAVVK
jgi:hypothetical protein